eukprot:9471712-Pyramimonas_sp.AAC.1
MRCHLRGAIHPVELEVVIFIARANIPLSHPHFVRQTHDAGGVGATDDDIDDIILTAGARH